MKQNTICTRTVSRATRPAVLTLALAMLLTASTAVAADTSRRMTLGFFEGGESIIHDELRTEFMNQLRLLLPDSIQAVASPDGYGSGQWKRDTCRAVARRLAATEGIDLMITMGPWVVEDLLAAGYSGPILAMHRVDPYREGLLDARMRPIAENLTVHYNAGKLENDLTAFVGLRPIRKLGVLYFPTGAESPRLLEDVRAIGQRLGFEVDLGEGDDINGTYAFFKAYGDLDSDCDAVYALPFWGMSVVKINDFLKRARQGHRPLMVWEGGALVNRGALASASWMTPVAEARFNAEKAVRILGGATPADLPVVFSPPGRMVINETTAKICNVPIGMAAARDAVLVDPVLPPTGSQFNLRAAVLRARDRHPTSLARDEAVEAARQAALETKAAYLPQIDASYRIERRDDNKIHNWDDRLERTGKTASLEMEQTLFSLEALRSIQAAKIDVDLAEIDRRRATLDLELAVTAAYLDHLRALAVLQVERDYQTQLDRAIEFARTTYILDTVGLEDLYRWHQDRDESSNRAALADRDAAISKAALLALMNFPADEPIELDTTDFADEQFLRDYSRLLPLLTKNGVRQAAQGRLLALAQEESPDSREYRLRTDLQRRLLSRNAARFFPTIGFRAALNYVDEQIDRPPQFYEEHGTWTIGAELRWSLFAGAERFRERSRLKAEKNRVEYERDAVTLDIMRRAAETVEGLAAQADNSFRSMRSLGLSEKTAELVTERYVPGDAGLFWELDDALNRHRRASLNAIDERFRTYYEMARVLNLAGRSILDQRLSLAGAAALLLGL